ncbi:MAG: DUF2812 domain-containing protein [Candidatus Izemoplasmataceae bacterium]
MKKIKFRPFWSYDIIKTQKWLNCLSKKGYRVVSFNTIFRTFSFCKDNPTSKEYIIIYDRGKNDYPAFASNSVEYDKISHTINYCILVQKVEIPEYFPSYEQLLSRNQKIKYVTGIILLIQFILFILPVSVILMSVLVGGGISVEYEPGGITTPSTTQELLEGILVIFVLFMSMLSQLWLLYSYLKLRKTNKKLEILSGEGIDLSFTIPTSTIMNKADLKQLKKEKKLVRKMKLGWFYSPDKHGQWLEAMESKGYNLIRMSKIGNSFYFIKGTPRKMKYHVDYQSKKEPNYFKINEESGWNLFFTSFTRYFSISVWGQEYKDVEPQYYSDQDDKVEHAKSFMLSYIIWMLPMSVMYFIIFGISIYGFIQIEFFKDISWVLTTPMIFLLTGLEFLYFSFRLIRYYNRVKAG